MSGVTPFGRRADSQPTATDRAASPEKTAHAPPARVQTEDRVDPTAYAEPRRPGVLAAARALGIGGEVVEAFKARFSRRTRKAIATRKVDAYAASANEATTDQAGLPSARKVLTRQIAATQGVRGEATIERIKLLSGRGPESLGATERTRLDQLDAQIDAASQRLDALKSKRKTVNAIAGDRWLDRLEVDVLAGGAIGIPGIASGSIAGGASMGDADRNTGMREYGLIAYAMPAVFVGGYGKVDLGYSRSEGTKLSAGGGVDFLGFWGGPGGDTWGNTFAGGFWSPMILNIGAGYGKSREANDEPYGAFILGTFWPPGSPAAARLDIVVRHPSFAAPATWTADKYRELFESETLTNGREWLSKRSEWASEKLRPLADSVGALSFTVRSKLAARGLPESESSSFINALRVLQDNDDSDLTATVLELREVIQRHPEHFSSRAVLSALLLRADRADEALATTKETIEAAQSLGDAAALNDARKNYMAIALLESEYERAQPVLMEWLADPKPHSLVDAQTNTVHWLFAQGREQEAKQIAEGLAFEHPFAVEVQHLLAVVTRDRPTAEVPT
ncbi:MAG: hypothetical protein AAF654_11995 [Myxococcota bacterium]